MKVIVIKEEDIQALMEKLELKKFQLNVCREPVDEIYQRFYYVVVSWLHEQGSSYPH